MNKSEEQKLLELVYAGSERLTVTSSEEPDFLCSHGENQKFGVEVTEFFASESFARLEKKSGYAHQLITTQKVIHKNDYIDIPVQELTYIPGGDKSKSVQIKGILHKNFTKQELVEKVVQCIESKAAKYKNYSRKESINVLIVNDGARQFYSKDNSKILDLLNFPRLNACLSGQEFQEIYLTFKDYKNETVYLPLMATALCQKAFSSIQYIKKLALDESNSKIAINPIAFIFRVLVKLGYGRSQVSFTDEGVSVRFASVYFDISKSGISIRSFLPKPLSISDISLEQAILELTSDNMDSLAQKYIEEGQYPFCKLNLSVLAKETKP